MLVLPWHVNQRKLVCGTKRLGIGSTYIFTDQDTMRSVKNASLPIGADSSFGKDFFSWKEPGTRTEWDLTIWRAKYMTVTGNEPQGNTVYHRKYCLINGNGARCVGPEFYCNKYCKEIFVSWWCENVNWIQGCKDFDSNVVVFNSDV